MKTHWKTLLGSLLFVIIVTSACKKNKPAVIVPRPPGFNDAWIEDIPVNPAAELRRTLNIWKDSIFFLVRNEVTKETTIVNGTFRTEENKFITNFKEIIVRHDNGKVISRNPVSSNYFDNATYLLDEYRLKLIYTGAPSDAGARATIVFRRYGYD